MKAIPISYEFKTFSTSDQTIVSVEYEIVSDSHISEQLSCYLPFGYKAMFAPVEVEGDSNE